ncbi:MAG: DUF2911 domain-containing protein [Vicinamibacterales bacterium]
MLIHRARVIFLSTLISSIAVGVVPASAQSPAATARGTVAGKAVSIQYSAPSVRGRQIFGAGGLLSKDPTYPIWRAGANAATTLTSAADLEFDGLRIPKGTYTLFVNVRDPNAWELVISKQTGQWGLDYDAKQDLGRVRMTMSKPAATVETLKYTVRDAGAGKGELRLEWEQHVGTVSFTAR